MEDKELIIFGTISTFTFNVMAIIISVVCIETLPLPVALGITAIFAAAAIYTDVKVIEYYIKKIKSKLKK